MWFMTGLDWQFIILGFLGIEYLALIVGRLQSIMQASDEFWKAQQLSATSAPILTSYE
jgi:hypothetical protein